MSRILLRNACFPQLSPVFWPRAEIPKYAECLCVPPRELFVYGGFWLDIMLAEQVEKAQVNAVWGEDAAKNASMDICADC